MDDLISRSAVKQEIESLQMTVTGLRAGKGVLRDFMNQYKESVLRIIDEQPTAYNVDKVVEQIKTHNYSDGIGWLALTEVTTMVKTGGVNG